jgi:hypothetical protein
VKPTSAPAAVVFDLSGVIARAPSPAGRADILAAASGDVCAQMLSGLGGVELASRNLRPVEQAGVWGWSGWAFWPPRGGRARSVRDLLRPLPPGIRVRRQWASPRSVDTSP